jgi:hypothetical protein
VTSYKQAFRKNLYFTIRRDTDTTNKPPDSRRNRRIRGTFVEVNTLLAQLAEMAEMAEIV